MFSLAMSTTACAVSSRLEPEAIAELVELRSAFGTLSWIVPPRK